MSFNVTGIADYTKQNEQMLLTKAVYSAKTAAALGTVDGVKLAANLPQITQAIVFQNAAVCPTTPSGTTTFSNRVITVGKIAIVDSWCLRDLDNKYTSLLETMSASQEAMPASIESVLVDNYQKEITKAVEVALWKGDTGSGTNNLSYFDGLVKIINAASGTVQANTTAFQAAVVTAITTSNILSIVDGIYQAIPEELLESVNAGDTYLAMGASNFRQYQLALKNANLFNYVIAGDVNAPVLHPGTSLKIVMFNGLTGTNAMYVANWKTNVYKAVAGEADVTSFKMWFSDDKNALQARVEFNLGVQIAFPSEIVKFTI